MAEPQPTETPNSKATDKEEQEKWENSKAKAILRSGLLKGTISLKTKPKEAWLMNPEEHGKWNYKNWSQNFATLKNALRRDTTRMQKDCLSYGHDLALLKDYRKKKPRGAV